MEQLKLEIVQEIDEEPAVALAEETAERLVELMSEAIIAAHQAPRGDGDE